jgi:hypothetical protein
MKRAILKSVCWSDETQMLAETKPGAFTCAGGSQVGLCCFVTWTHVRKTTSFRRCHPHSAATAIGLGGAPCGATG